MKQVASKAVLLSIRPKYADLILSGDKTVELRRIRPKYLQPGSLVLMYASSPISSMVGAFSVDSIFEKPLDELWEEVKEKSGISYDEFKLYFEGINKGVGIFIKDCWALSEPISLGLIKQKVKSFAPPQSFRYATETDVSSFCGSGDILLNSNNEVVND
jgi:predicted transcriptional regulator